MGLATFLGDFDKLIAGQLLGLRQNRTGDLDRIVGRKPTDDPGRSIANRREPRAQFDQRLLSMWLMR